MRFLLATALAMLLCSCYEDSTGCLDPDADNYDLVADLGCLDCCTFPELSVRLATVWKDSAVVLGRTYTDGAGNDFQFVRFRYYLGDLRLESSTTDLADPSRPLELIATDSTTLSLNGNYLLASLSTTTTAVGALRTGTASLTALTGSYGLPDRYRTVAPARAPNGDALRTQPGRLNFNDGRGYVQARLEYTRMPGGDTLSVSSFGSSPFALSFGETIVPIRGFDIRIDLEADLHKLLSATDLSADSTTISNLLRTATSFISVVGYAQ